MRNFACGTHFVAQRPLVAGYNECINVFPQTLLNVHVFSYTEGDTLILYSIWQFAKIFGKQDS